jgi:hypothetical protein
MSERATAQTFRDLVVWQKAHQPLEECRYYLILGQDLKYGDSGELMRKLEEVSRMLFVYSKAILNSGF